MDWRAPTNKKRKADENIIIDENEIVDNEEDVHISNVFVSNGQYIRSTGSDIYFYAGINKKNIIALQRETQKVVENIVSKATEAEKIGCTVTYPPIKLHISSPGGDVYSTFAFIDFMTQVKLKNRKILFHTIIEGGSASGATLMSVTGDKRFITEYGYMLIHQLSGCSWGKYEDLKDDMKNSKELMERIKQIYQKHTNLSKSELNKILKHDLYWDAEKCLECGLVDEILKI